MSTMTRHGSNRPTAANPLTVRFLELGQTGAKSIDVHVILFDMDGTLVDSQAVVDRHTRQWAHRHALDPDAVVRHSHGRRDTEFIPELVPHADPDEELAWLNQLSSSDCAGVRPANGAAELLHGLASGQWGVVTSATRKVAHSRMTAAGLRLPEVLICAEDVAAGKPDPEGYLAAAQSLGAIPADCLVIEDAEVGLLAAKAAGMPALAVTGPRHPVHGNRIAGLASLTLSTR